MLPELSREELLRYSRHVILPGVGEEGQRKLKAAKVLLVGAGGLGSPSALYLAAAGIGHLGIVDFDEVDATNLHRQILHGTPDIGRSKLESAREKIHAINPNVQITTHEAMLTSQNALMILRDYDLIVDGTDNFPTRYLVNDACVLLKKINVYGSIFQFDGQATVFCAPGGPCYRCLYPEPPPPGTVPSCAEAGVFGVLPGLIGLIQSTEAVKLILGIGEPLIGRLLMYDALGMRFNEVRVRRDENCPICGDRPTQFGLIDYDQFCGVESKNVQSDGEMEAPDLLRMMGAGEPFSLIDVREPDENETVRIPGGVLIPLDQVLQRMNEIERDKPAILYCRSGNRSGVACQMLKAQGMNNAINLRGGIIAWMQTEGPIERG